MANLQHRAHIFSWVWLVWLPASVLAQPSPQAVPTGLSPDPASSRPLSVHAVRGVVTTVHDGTIILSRFHHRGDIRLTIGAAAHRTGDIRPGSIVSVRYRDEGHDHVVTGIVVQRPAGPPPSDSTTRQVGHQAKAPE